MSGDYTYTPSTRQFSLIFILKNLDGGLFCEFARDLTSEKIGSSAVTCSLRLGEVPRIEIEGHIEEDVETDVDGAGTITFVSFLFLNTQVVTVILSRLPACNAITSIV